MRVFRKRQLRLREENNEPELNLTGDTNHIEQSLSGAQLNAQISNRRTKVTFPSNSSSPSNIKAVYNPTGSVTNSLSNAANAVRGANLDTNSPVTVNIDANGKITNESRFSGNLIEGAVMFSKKELRDFLKGL